MSNVTFVPGRPAVTQVVEAATDPKVVVELSIPDAQVIGTLLGGMSGAGVYSTYPVFDQLLSVLAKNGVKPAKLRCGDREFTRIDPVVVESL